MIVIFAGLKKNAVNCEIHSFKCPENSNVLLDEIVYNGTIQGIAKNIFRLVEVVDTKGNILRLIANQFELGTDEMKLVMFTDTLDYRTILQMDETTCRKQTFLRDE